MKRTPTISDFISSLELGFSFLQQAGEKLVAMKENDFDVFDQIIQEHRWITREMLEVILAIGKKEIHPKALLLPRHVTDRVVSMPYSEQENMADEFISRRYEGRPATGTARDCLTREVVRSVLGEKLSEPTPKLTLYVEGTQAVLTPATTNRKPQTVILDKNGEAVVVFRKRP